MCFLVYAILLALSKRQHVWEQFLGLVFGLLGGLLGLIMDRLCFLSNSIGNNLLNLRYSVVDILGMIVTKTPPLSRSDGRS